MIRYMGTKRHMAAAVRGAIESVSTEGTVLDLFAGMGTVAEQFVDLRPVHVNDASEFAAVQLRARFGPTSINQFDVEAFRSLVSVARERLNDEFAHQLATEASAVSGDKAELARYMQRAQHAANSPSARALAKAAAASSGMPHYRLASLYFSAGYLSLRQAIDTDALRYAIDQQTDFLQREQLLARWFTAISDVLNAPGHAAQFLKPSSGQGVERVRRAWGKDLEHQFWSAGVRASGDGSSGWREGNRVTVSDALTLLRSGEARRASVVYADPPYTRDQYGRFYHLYETLFRYDYPAARGAGRVRDDTFVSGFSRKTKVESSLRELLRLTASFRQPLVLSYPSNGLLTQAGASLPDIAREYFSQVLVTSFEADHSTLGGSSGTRTKSAVEQIITCA